MNARRIPLSLVVGALLVGVLALIALVSLAWLPYPIEDTSGGRLEGFSTEHLLGTDRLGHDLASRMMVGARIALIVGLGAVAVAALIGVSVGLAIALARPWVDDVASALLDDDRADERGGQLDAGDGDDRDRGDAQAVAHHRLATRLTQGARELQEGRVEHVQGGAARVARQQGRGH